MKLIQIGVGMKWEMFDIECVSSELERETATRLLADDSLADFARFRKEASLEYFK